MDAPQIAMEFRDPIWIAVAFLLGLGVRQLGLPPLVGFLIAGFALNWAGAESGDFLVEIANLGITLLLFSIGLKLHIRQLLKPEVWGTTLIHMSAFTVSMALLLMALATLSFPFFTGMDWQTALLAGFALSFSSTVFAVKALEEKDDMMSRHGQLAIGILIIQDIVAVLFLAFSTAKMPSPWAVTLFLLFPLRPVLLKLMEKAGHGELLLLFGFLVAIGGAELFALAGIKDDIGALVMGILLAGHPKTNELAKAMLGFKELFLIGFFLGIGLNGLPTFEILLASIVILAVLPFKTALYFWLTSKLRLRARTSTLTALHLANYSEFGLIVGVIGYTNGWLSADWLVLIAVVLAASFIIASPLNSRGDHYYTRHHDRIKRFESPVPLATDEPIDLAGTRILIFGMGRVGTGAYDALAQEYGDAVAGIDFDIDTVEQLRATGRRVLHGDGTNPDFCQRIRTNTTGIETILLTLPNHRANLAVIDLLRKNDFKGEIAATALYPDQAEALRNMGIKAAYDIYSRAGTSFAEHAMQHLGKKTGT